MTNIDLRTCQPGQPLRMRDGGMVEYIGPTHGPKYPHLIRYKTGNAGSRTDNGLCYEERQHEADIVEILPMPPAANPLIWGASTPGTEPVPATEAGPEWTELTESEAIGLWNRTVSNGLPFACVIRHIYAAGFRAGRSKP